jgi:hypothetical protein
VEQPTTCPVSVQSSEPVPVVGADPVDAVEVGREGVQEFGASRRWEGLEALAEGLLYLLERHDADPVPLDDSVRSEWRM